MSLRDKQPDSAAQRSRWSRRLAPVFMLLAGVLGAAVIELVPVNDLVTLPNTLLMALLVAAIGAFLPVPIAFDVVIVSLLIASGVPVLFSMTLLFVLGIFSIYPFLILWRNVSPKVSLGLFLGAIVVGLGCGYGLQAHEQWTTERVIAAYEKNSQEQAAALPVEQLHSPTVAEIHAQDVAIATRICKQHDHPVAQVLCLADLCFRSLRRGAMTGSARPGKARRIARYGRFASLTTKRRAW